MLEAKKIRSFVLVSPVSVVNLKAALSPKLILSYVCCTRKQKAEVVSSALFSCASKSRKKFATRGGEDSITPG